MFKKKEKLQVEIKRSTKQKFYWRIYDEEGVFLAITPVNHHYDTAYEALKAAERLGKMEWKYTAQDCARIVDAAK